MNGEAMSPEQELLRGQSIERKDLPRKDDAGTDGDSC